MDAEQQLTQWNTTFHILDGGLVCQFCQTRQALVAAEQRFIHAESCQQQHSQFDRPWITLHEILDRFRG